ncbi:Trafficking protein particle complex subunit [Lachnellula suecica]|uniref:Trafficking protein particle complex subunit n=1 Tax=Lachnellula suecica TaxID=602035 RepID=A0A8T9C9Q3_9HELO|nr:Trafficking protein particle complex subunit [Lachnellula suecica]
MEQPSSSSKVTVEYFDPHGVYQLLSPGLLPRLPLRNLHWESHAGPLRSISSLHIDLVPSAQELGPPSSADTGSSTPLSRVKSEDSTASGDDGFRKQALGQAAVEKSEVRPDSAPKPLVKERRHQIPGLRQTPYLKVLVLRCDDNDTYKAQARRQVREWIKEHTPPTQSTTKQNTQENHDAFEWLIIHVVVPNTAAATQPKTSGKSSEGSSGSTAEKSTTRWRGGGSSTILEKLRADFNGSSKSAVDRVAQIRIGINDVPYEMLPRVVPAIPGSYTESPQENENAWIDLISKFKALILASFDMRVSQYEEDIREKDAQRTLPGWNFCTFFVLKEGLARGFENVGLVEDALVVYDELAIGLDAIIREQTTGSGAEHGGSFLPYTEDLRQQAERAKIAILKNLSGDSDDSGTADTDDPIDLQSNTNPVDREIDEIPLNAAKKRYRELILSNDISVFDFRCYIFARQLSLLLRLANAWSSKEELLAKLKEQRESSLQGVAARVPANQPSEDVENLATLAHICTRSLDFVTSITRIMRDDIWASQAKAVKTGEVEDEKSEAVLETDPIMSQVVDNIASSFTFAVAQQILAQTSTKSLPIPPSTLAPPSAKIGLEGQEQKAAIPEPKTMMHPARSSSLAIHSPPREPTGAAAFPSNRRSSVPEQSPAPSTFLKIGLEDLAGYRAELYLLSRNVLEVVGKERGWSAGWEEVTQHYHDKADEMQDVDLEDDSSGKQDTVTAASSKPAPSLYGIDNKLLRTAVDSKDDFYRLYETLTDKALRHYTVANRTQSVLVNMTELAVLKYHLEDFAAAASYFYRMTPSYGQSGWSQVELPMLVMYAKSLKKLQRKDEFVRVVLKLLEKVAAAEKERQARKSTLRLGGPSSLSSTEPPSSFSYLQELLDITKTLQHEIRVPLTDYFSRVEVDSTPRYHPGRDSFALQLRLRYLLPEELTIEKAKVRITSLDGDTKREIWLESDGPSVFKNEGGEVMVQTNTIVPGTYTVSHVSLHTSNITLHYEHGSAVPTPGQSEVFFRCPKLLIYHRAEAFDVKLFASRYMHLDRNRSLELELFTGWNEVTSGELHVRAATAGLRLQTSEARVISGTLELSKKLEAGVVRFGSLAAGTTAKISVPYNLEHDSSEISLKLELSYTTENGTFFFATTPRMSILLPLGVNVQDVFKHKALFSKFTISSATSSPLRLLSCQLDDSEVFEAKCGVSFSEPLVLFPRQPASMLYKITKSIPKSEAQASGKKLKAALSLVLHYICLEEEIENAITLSLQQALRDTPMYPYTRLIIPTVVNELQARLSPYDLERIAVLSEIPTSILATVRWQDHFAGLGRLAESDQDVPTLLAEGLQAWQQRVPNILLIPLTTTEETISTSRSIIIPVEVPSVTVVHTADLKFLESSLLPAKSMIAASNQPIPTSLDIKWTRNWETSLQQENDISSQPDGLDFVYEVTGAADTWLIGGRRKGHFKVPNEARAGDTKHKLSFPVVLIPLREGFLPLPNVDIKPAPAVKVLKPGAEEASSRKKSPVTCETDHKNAGETIRVISDARKTTVSLDASGPQGERCFSRANGGVLVMEEWCLGELERLRATWGFLPASH